MSEQEDSAAEGGSTRLEVGRIVRAHGIRGEVIVEAVSNRPDRFTPGSELHSADRPFLVRTAGRHRPAQPAGRATRDRWIVGFEGVATRNEAEELRGTVLFGEAKEDSEEEALWVHELVGAEVVDLMGRVLGRVEAVEANPASDLLVLAGGGLVPLVFVRDTSPGRIVVDPPPGLLEL